MESGVSCFHTGKTDSCIYPWRFVFSHITLRVFTRGHGENCWIFQTLARHFRALTQTLTSFNTHPILWITFAPTGPKTKSRFAAMRTSALCASEPSKTNKGNREGSNFKPPLLYQRKLAKRTHDDPEKKLRMVPTEQGPHCLTG
jgi:hypothetical protein